MFDDVHLNGDLVDVLLLSKALYKFETVKDYLIWLIALKIQIQSPNVWAQYLICLYSDFFYIFLDGKICSKLHFFSSIFVPKYAFSSILKIFFQKTS